ncbi:GntR family transcriptional regulator [Clostridium perfringens]|nr:GntR family transcriptional regulator [Clostridium perfringens]
MTLYENGVYTVYIEYIQYIYTERGEFLNIVVSNTSGVPIYEQIAKAIKNEILSGDLKENSALPSIRSLASELRVSVITTKRAYEELERDGFIYTLPGKGSYVAEQNKELLMEEKLREIEEKLGEAMILQIA